MGECHAEIAPATFERAVDSLIDCVLARLAGEDVDGRDLTDLWQEVLEERRDPERAAWRKLEALLGCDPGEAPDALIGQLREQASGFGADAIEEIAADSMGSSLSRLRQVAEIRQQSLPRITVPETNGDTRRASAEDPSLPWIQAEHDAAAARSVWHLPDGPVHDNVLNDLFSCDSRELTAVADATSATSLTAGFRGDDAPNTLRVHIPKALPASRRFALARLAGDHLLGTDDTLLPATDAKTARQKYQRAFAQSLLCPFDDLQEFLGSALPAEEEIEAAAAHYQVSPLMVQTILVNKGVLDRSRLASS